VRFPETGHQPVARDFGWGAQAASLRFVAACHEHLRERGVKSPQEDPPGKLPGGTGWQPVLPKNS